MKKPLSTQNTQEMNSLQNLPHATAESCWAQIQASQRYLTEMFAKSERERKRERKKEERILKEKFAESSRELTETERILKEMFAETDRLIKETRKDMQETDRLQKENARQIEKTDRQIKELNSQYGGISNSNGDMAEEYFFNAFKRNKTFMNQTFDKVLRNKWIDTEEWKAEFDLLLLNGKSVVIIEVKYKAEYNIKIQKLVSRVRPFKALFPEYKNHNIYLGVAAMSFNKFLAAELRETGIATIHQVGNKMVIYDQELRAF
jgi:hypothetical protein